MEGGVQIVDVYQYKDSIPIDTLLSGYTDDELYPLERVVPIQLPYGSTMGQVKEIIENFISIPQSLQRISFNIGENEIDDESFLLPAQITTLHVERYSAPTNIQVEVAQEATGEDYGVEKSIKDYVKAHKLKKLKQRDETGKEVTLTITYIGKKISIDTRSSYKISEIKEDLKKKYEELSGYDNSELRFLSENSLEDHKYLKTYLADLYNANTKLYSLRLVVRVDDGGYSQSQFQSYASLVSDVSAQQELQRLADEANGEEISIFPITDIPANYKWVMKIKDYSEKAERNEELITEKQKQIIYDYTGEHWYAQINLLLATLTTPPKKEREFIQTLILACCDSYQKSLPTQVIRMTSLNDKELNFYKQHEGETVCVPSFMSTSRIEMPSFGTVRIIIELTQGKRRGAMDIAKYSKYKKEDEILLSAFSFYKIISVNLSVNPKEIRLAYLDALHHYREDKKK